MPRSFRLCLRLAILAAAATAPQSARACSIWSLSYWILGSGVESIYVISTPAGAAIVDIDREERVGETAASLTKAFPFRLNPCALDRVRVVLNNGRWRLLSTCKERSAYLGRRTRHCEL